MTTAEKCEAAAQAFDALGYTAQFNTIADSVRLSGGGTGISISPHAFIVSLNERARALRNDEGQQG